MVSAPAARRHPRASPAVTRRSSPAARSIVETVAPPTWTQACGARDPASPSAMPGAGSSPSVVIAADP